MVRSSIITRIAAATLIAGGFATAAVAEQTGPRLVGTGDNVSIEYPAARGNVVGGALSRLAGDGENAGVEAISVQNVQPGRAATLVGSGENATVIYADPIGAAHGAARG
jgi:hypothetical protein